jgi:hypothetical protein
VIDYMSLDVEGAEWVIMEHWPYDTHTIHVLTVERPPPALLNKLKAVGYVLLGTLGSFGEHLLVHETVPGGVAAAKAKFKEGNDHRIRNNAKPAVSYLDIVATKERSPIPEPHVCSFSSGGVLDTLGNWKFH